MTLVVVGAFAVFIMTSEFRRAGVRLFPTPERGARPGQGATSSHSLIAFGRGEIFGVGLGGTAKLHYKFEDCHTDFCSPIGEGLDRRAGSRSSCFSG
jgi:cell division protein FtsW